MKKPITKLHLNKQQLRVLGVDDLAQAAGGWIRPPITWSCPQELSNIRSTALVDRLAGILPAAPARP